MAKKDSLELIERLQDVNYQLMDEFRSGLSWLLNYCSKNNYPYPDLDKAMALIHTSGSFLDNYQPTGNTYSPNRRGNRTRYKILLPYRLFFLIFIAEDRMRQFQIKQT